MRGDRALGNSVLRRSARPSLQEGFVVCWPLVVFGAFAGNGETVELDAGITMPITTVISFPPFFPFFVRGRANGVGDWNTTFGDFP